LTWFKKIVFLALIFASIAGGKCVHQVRGKLVRAAGFEPAAESSQVIENQCEADEALRGYTQIRAQISDEDCRALARVVESWPRLGGGLKQAILAIIDADCGEGGGK